MTSEISILRKFLSLKDKDKNINFFVSSHKVSIHYGLTSSIFNHDMKLYLGSYGIVYIFDFHKNNALFFNSGILRMARQVVDPDDFQNYDDISLVLKYGRDILNENILFAFNNRCDIELSISDFNLFLNQ